MYIRISSVHLQLKCTSTAQVHIDFSSARLKCTSVATLALGAAVIPSVQVGTFGALESIRINSERGEGLVVFLDPYNAGALLQAVTVGTTVR